MLTVCLLVAALHALHVVFFINFIVNEVFYTVFKVLHCVMIIRRKKIPKVVHGTGQENDGGRISLFTEGVIGITASRSVVRN